MKSYIKKIVIMGILGLSTFSIIQQIKSYCPDGNCPYTEIDCAKCCSAGRFISDECVRLCNCSLETGYKADMAHAESKDFPH